jgi:hypothetical protein
MKSQQRPGKERLLVHLRQQMKTDKPMKSIPHPLIRFFPLPRLLAIVWHTLWPSVSFCCSYSSTAV